MDAQDDVQEKAKPMQLKGFKESIEFEMCRSATSDEEGRKEVLHDFNLTVPRGEVVALVGPSGAGKSTLVNLIPRFFDVTGGAHPDGRARSARPEAAIRCASRSAKVTQETVLFNDTVRNNIAYGQPDVPHASVVDGGEGGAGA